MAGGRRRDHAAGGEADFPSLLGVRLGALGRWQAPPTARAPAHILGPIRGLHAHCLARVEADLVTSPPPLGSPCVRDAAAGLPGSDVAGHGRGAFTSSHGQSHSGCQSHNLLPRENVGQAAHQATHHHTALHRLRATAAIVAQDQGTQNRRLGHPTAPGIPNITRTQG